MTALLTGRFGTGGRLSRRAYQRLVIRLAIGSDALLWLAIVLAAHGFRGAALAAFAGIAVLALAGLVQTVRRLHDRGRTGWWLCLFLGLNAASAVPVDTWADTYPIASTLYVIALVAVSLWFLVETLGRRGICGPSRFGPDPLRRRPSEGRASEADREAFR